jgi:pimeloyl-ACP methyl ester carboxylesterase
LQAWGNNAAVARAVEAMNYGEANLDVTGKWTLIGGSMGNANQFATAKANPTRVKGIAGIIPLMSIPDIMSKGVSAEVNAAYGGTYVDATDGPAHSPISMATTIDPALPIHLWCAPDDTLVPYSIAEAFVATRPQTGFTTLPNGGHTNASIGNAAAGVAAFVASLA